MGAVKQMVIENQDLKKQLQDYEHYAAYLHTFVADVVVGAIDLTEAWPMSFTEFVSNVLTPSNDEVKEL